MVYAIVSYARHPRWSGAMFFEFIPTSDDGGGGDAGGVGGRIGGGAGMAGEAGEAGEEATLLAHELQVGKYKNRRRGR